MLTGKMESVMTSWKNKHARWVLPKMTQNFVNSLVATWKTLMHPHLKRMHQQVAVFKQHASFCLVSKSARGYFPVVGIGAFDGLAQPSD